MFTLVEAKPKTENEKYLESKEWQELIEKAAVAVNQSITIIYRDTDGELKEAWHWLSDLNLEHVKAKYKKANKEIIRFGPKEYEYGVYLSMIKGGSKIDS